MSSRGDLVRYSILDPTGNITALVESAVEVDRQPAMAQRVMANHPTVEQVGFVSFMQDGDDHESPSVSLRMAGGEFCGNATMSAATLYAVRKDLSMPAALMLSVSGVSRPVEVSLDKEAERVFSARIGMPEALSIDMIELGIDAMRDTVPLVRMEGISHVMVEPSSALRDLLFSRSVAERAVRKWCRELETDGLGIMFLSGMGTRINLTPLVFVPGSGTVFWENSCASGSAAMGMYLAHKESRAIDVSLCEPGGILRVQSEPAWHRTWLHGGVRLVGEYGFAKE